MFVYRWTKKGGALPQGRTTYDNYGKTLVIKHVDFNDEGDYTCEASNGVGLAQSYSIQLKVYAQPYFTKEPESQTAAEVKMIMIIKMIMIMIMIMMITGRDSHV